MTYTLELTDIADERVRHEIVVPLAAYNASKAGPSHGLPLVITVRDASGDIVGGLWGSTGFQWLFTQLLVVPENLRGHGVGTDLMSRAETEALRRGCHSAWLDTFEFQARGFYERIGYACFAQLPDYPEGFSRFFMKKSLRIEAVHHQPDL
jgi:GNAT superfamily N-acetyltransferase